jgi:hypothetical protein
MKTKIVFHLALVVALATFATGCCTAMLVGDSKEKTTDTFNPSAVYQSTNGDGFALQGIRHNNPDNNKPPLQTYLIISQASLASQHLQTNSNLSLNDVKKLSADLAKHPDVQKTLPASYVKVADLPKNDIGLDVKEHHPKRVELIFIPFSVAVDVATSPIQIPFFLLLAGGMSHGSLGG